MVKVYIFTEYLFSRFLWIINMRSEDAMDGDFWADEVADDLNLLGLFLILTEDYEFRFNRQPTEDRYYELF